MSYNDEFRYYNLNPKYCESLKEEIIERLKNDMLFDEETTEVNVVSQFDVVVNKYKLLVIIDRIPLISLEIDINSTSSDITWKVMNAYNKRFGDTND